MMNQPIYDHTFPVHPSRSTWRCAPACLWWALASWGFNCSQAWLERALLDADLLVPKMGMRDKTGADLADWVNRHLGGTGFVAAHREIVTFDNVVFEATIRPLILYGRAWAHWCGVRRADLAYPTLLRLANPNPGYVHVHDVLNREAFGLLGPFNLLAIDRPSFRRIYAAS